MHGPELEAWIDAFKKELQSVTTRDVYADVTIVDVDHKIVIYKASATIASLAKVLDKGCKD